MSAKDLAALRQQRPTRKFISHDPNKAVEALAEAQAAGKIAWLDDDFAPGMLSGAREWMGYALFTVELPDDAEFEYAPCLDGGFRDEDLTCSPTAALARARAMKVADPEALVTVVIYAKAEV
jgi:hypothetical protein